jgi:hypothetical protein
MRLLAIRRVRTGMRWFCLSIVFLVACQEGMSPPPPACPATDPKCDPPSEDRPRILTLSSNVMTLDNEGMLVITSVVTDPDGVDDLIGGALVDPDTNATYGAFATSAAEGAYEIRLGWGQLNDVRPIDAPVTGVSRVFVAQFYDVAGHVAEQELTVKLRCSLDDMGVCDGDCIDLATDPENCGACDSVVPAGSVCTNGMPGCAQGPEATPAACSDGCSNDGDTYVDCNDFNCCSVVACPVGSSCNP